MNQSDLIAALDHLGAEAKPCLKCADSWTILSKAPSNGPIRDPTLTWGLNWPGWFHRAGLVNLGKLFNLSISTRLFLV